MNLRKTTWAEGRPKSTKYLILHSYSKFCAFLRKIVATAHNLKVTSSNLVPATKMPCKIKCLRGACRAPFSFLAPWKRCGSKRARDRTRRCVEAGDGRKARLMTLIDEFTRECLAIRVARRINSLIPPRLN